MGRKIRIPDEEYRMLVNETAGIHKNVINVVEYYLKELDALLVPEGGFYADLISDKAKLVLNIFREQIVKKLEEEYQETENSLINYGNKMREIDQSGEGRIKWQELI